MILQRPGHAWPLLLAANRDEALDRAWDPPGAYWPDRPGVVAGRDRTGGGTWMGVNRAGLVATVLNRPGSLGPAPGRRSRGELPLIALGHATADCAAKAIGTLDGTRYRSFNLVLASRESVWFVRNDDAGVLTSYRLPPGLHMVTAYDPDDIASPRVVRHWPRFAAAAPPEPPDWTTWVGLLGDESGPRPSALSVASQAGFGTACASLLGLPESGAPEWLFAPGRAAQTAFAHVALPPPEAASGEPAPRLL